MPGLNEWLAIASTADADELRERILTGYKSGKPFTPYVPTVALPEALDWVLDFGCGVGRSFSFLKSAAKHVAGFDIKPMIQRCRALATEPVDLLSADWKDVSARPFDLIFSALVLQHLETDACRRYLEDFARMAPATYVLTRLQSDFQVNVLGLVAESGLFEAVDCVEVEHDPARHQLRQVSRRPFEEVARSAGGEHYEVILRSKARSGD